MDQVEIARRRSRLEFEISMAIQNFERETDAPVVAVILESIDIHGERTWEAEMKVATVRVRVQQWTDDDERMRSEIVEGRDTREAGLPF